MAGLTHILFSLISYLLARNAAETGVVFSFYQLLSVSLLRCEVVGLPRGRPRFDSRFGRMLRALNVRQHE